MPGIPTETLLAGEPADRTAAAETIRGIAAATPDRLYGSIGRIADALADDHRPVRRAVAGAISEVATGDAAAVAPVAEPLVDALDDDATAVRASAARSLAALATARPQRLRFAVPAFVHALADAGRVRDGAARALAALASRYPEPIGEHVDALTRALLDDRHPVQTGVLRTVTVLERCDPGLLDVAADRLRELCESPAPAVRQAACRAVAASDPRWGRSLLADRVRIDPHPLVRETTRDALTALTAPESPDAAADARGETAFATADRGTWIAVRPDRDREPAFLVGRVTAIDRERSDVDRERERTYGVRRADFDDRDAWLAAPRVEPTGDRSAVHLHDPVRDSGINLVRVERGIGAEYTDPDRDVPTLSLPASIRVVSADLAALLAAGPGDTLSFALEGTDHEIEVTDVTDGDAVYRVVGRNVERGYGITFRPLSEAPLMAVFEKGRAFRATDVSLSAGG